MGCCGNQKAPVKPKLITVGPDFFLREFQLVKLHSFGFANEQYIAIERKTKMESFIRVIPKTLRVLKLIDLQHPNLAKVLQLYQNEHYIFVQTQHYKDALPIFEYIDSLKFYMENTVAKLISQLFKLVADLSEQGIVHYSLNPQKILVTPDETIVVLGILDDYLEPTNLHPLLVPPEMNLDPHQIPSEPQIVYILGAICAVLLNGGLPKSMNISKISFQDASKIAIQAMKCLMHEQPQSRYSARRFLEQEWLKIFPTKPDDKFINQKEELKIIQQDASLVAQLRTDILIKEFVKSKVYVLGLKEELSIALIGQEVRSFVDIQSFKKALGNDFLIMAIQQYLKNLPSKLNYSQTLDNLTTETTSQKLRDFRALYPTETINKYQIAPTLSQIRLKVPGVEEQFQLGGNIFRTFDNADVNKFISAIETQTKDAMNQLESLLRMEHIKFEQIKPQIRKVQAKLSGQDQEFLNASTLRDKIKIKRCLEQSKVYVKEPQILEEIDQLIEKL